MATIKRRHKSSSHKIISPKQLHERIKKKAYELYVKRGYIHGDDWADWFEAEKIVKAELKKKKG